LINSYYSQTFFYQAPHTLTHTLTATHDETSSFFVPQTQKI